MKQRGSFQAKQGWARKLLTDWLKLPTGELKCSFHTAFCKISSEKNPNFPPTGARCFLRGAVAPGPLLAPPLNLTHFEVPMKLKMSRLKIRRRTSIFNPTNFLMKGK